MASLNAQGLQLRRAPSSLSKRSLNMEHKIPYVDLISDAILRSPEHRLTSKEIFEHVSAKYGPMKKVDTLKNTIRHTLSRYEIFRKVPRGVLTKPNWWTVDKDLLYGVGQGVERAHCQPQQQHPQQDQQQAPDVGRCGYLVPGHPVSHNFFSQSLLPPASQTLTVSTQQSVKPVNVQQWPSSSGVRHHTVGQYSNAVEDLAAYGLLESSGAASMFDVAPSVASSYLVHSFM